MNYQNQSDEAKSQYGCCKNNTLLGVKEVFIEKSKMVVSGSEWIQEEMLSLVP